MEYPEFQAVADATHTEPMARLLWMAMAKLSTEGKYATKTPEEILCVVKTMAEKVYAYE